MTEKVDLRSRVVDHGEVFTPPGLVRDMLDQPGVAEECLRIDARFLEPACGDGNFLAEVLWRRLGAVSGKHPKRALIPWERDALRGLANLYGIELLADNVEACRDRLAGVFEEAYRARFGGKARSAVVDAARHILAANVHRGDALKMATAGDDGSSRPLVFTQWSMLPGGRFKRRLFEYRELIAPEQERGGLFAPAKEQLVGNDGRPVFLAEPAGDLPLVHYLELHQEPIPE